MAISGLNDEVKCFYCDGIVQCWAPDDDPWREHIQWFPKCGFLKILKMEGAIQIPDTAIYTYCLGVPNKINDSEGMDEATIKSNQDDRYSSKKPDNLENIDLKKEIKRLQEEKLCKICLDKEREVLFSACGHFVSCNNCALSLQNCPVCRKEIDHFFKIYLS